MEGRKKSIMLLTLLLTGCALTGEGVPTQQYTAEVIDAIETHTEIINENIPPWMLAVAIIGWILPTPTQIFSSMSGFILKLFGRII